MSKNPVSNTYNFVSTSNRQLPIDSDQYQLIIRQQPKQARLCNSKERDRRPVDPPPIIQLKVDGYGDEAQNFLQSPYYFMCANLVHPTDNSESFTVSSSYLAGTVVSSLHKLKDIDNHDGGFFVFGDISVRVEGRYRLRFSLFEIVRNEVVHIHSVTSDMFTVYSPKTFPGMSESTFLSRSFSDQGVRIRIRKEHRIQMKRPPSNNNRPSDTIEDDNMNNDDDASIKRKRNASAYYPSSQQSPYASSHNQYPSKQRGLSYPPPLGYSQLYPPQRQHSYYEDSEYESSSHDEHMSIRSSSVSSSYHNNGHELYEQSVLNKRPKLSNTEIMSYDYRQPSTTPLNNNHFTTNHHHNATSPPSSSPYRSSQRRTTLPPLLEHHSYATNTSPSHTFNHHSSLPPTRHHSFDTLTSTASSTTTPLDSSFNYPVTSTTTSTPTQLSQPSDSYYRPPPPPSTSSSSSSSSQLFPPRPPVRSRTLPYIGSSNNSSHNMYHNHQSTASSNQLPTPKTSSDNKKLYPPYHHHPLTPPNQNNSSVDSYNNGNNDSDNDIPRFTKHFTLSPRPVPLQLPSKSPLSNNNNNGITKASSLPVMSSGSNVSFSNTTTFLNNEGGTLTSSPQLLPTTTNLRLPPITTLTEGIDYLYNNSNNNYNGYIV